MKNNFFIFLMFVFQCGLLFGQNYYRSNSIGLIYEKVTGYRLDEYDWVLEIRIDENVEKRVLFFKGAEFKNFELITNGNIQIKSEYQGEDLIHVEKKQNGLVFNEENYENNILINEYFYEWTGRQLNKTTYFENKLLIYEDHFILNENGEVIQIRRKFIDDQQRTSGITNFKHGRSYEWYTGDDEFIYYEYEEGILVKIETWQNEILTRLKTFTYSDSGRHETENDIISGKIAIKTFDKNGNIVSELITNGNIEEKTVYNYNNNLLIIKEVASSGVRTKYFYEYDIENNLKLEKIIENDVLIKEIYYTNGEKSVENLYKNNTIILKVIYENGEIINEEYIQ